jgi:phage gp36-like protein
MTSPPAVYYATISDLRLVLDSTDAGTGTAAQLTDAQLDLALRAATDRVSVYAGTAYDPASAPGLVADLTLDLAAWYATTYYLKQKDMPATHPVMLRYTEAVKILDAVRKGEITLDVSVSAAASARVINRIPNIFTGEDSNTAVDPGTGTLYAATPPELGPSRRLLAGQWLEYAG